MNRYLVESTHAAEDCHHVVEQFIFHGHVMNFDWGCEKGIHSGWAILEAENEAMALMAVPPAPALQVACHKINQVYARKVPTHSRLAWAKM